MEANLKSLPATFEIEPNGYDLEQYFDEEGSVINDGLVLDALKSFMNTDQLPDSGSFEFALLSRIDQEDLLSYYPDNYADGDEEEKDFARAYNNFRKQCKNDNLSTTRLNSESKDAFESKKIQASKPEKTQRSLSEIISEDVLVGDDIDTESLRNVFFETRFANPESADELFEILSDAGFDVNTESDDRNRLAVHDSMLQGIVTSIISKFKNDKAGREVATDSLDKWAKFNTKSGSRIFERLQANIIVSIMSGSPIGPLAQMKQIDNNLEQYSDTAGKRVGLFHGLKDMFEGDLLNMPDIGRSKGQNRVLDSALYLIEYREIISRIIPKLSDGNLDMSVDIRFIRTDKSTLGVDLTVQEEIRKLSSKNDMKRYFKSNGIVGVEYSTKQRNNGVTDTKKSSPAEFIASEIVDMASAKGLDLAKKSN